MRVSIFVFILTGTIIAGITQDFWQNRFGIVPLRSTRADVERLYGKSSESCRCIFRTSKETISVAYATAPCAGPVYGWNVSRDTVLSFTITPSVDPQVSEMAFDQDGFVKRYSPEESATTYYTAVEKGVVVTVQHDRILDVTYFPPSNEIGKRCEGFPAWDGVPPPTRFATIFGRDKTNLYARLDNLAFELTTNTQTRGYVISYAGKKSYRGEAEEMADEARRYLIDKRMISPNRVITINGGFRETAQYDLFSLSSQFPPPTPTPTVPSNEVQIGRPTTRAKRRSPK